MYWKESRYCGYSQADFEVFAPRRANPLTDLREICEGPLFPVKFRDDQSKFGALGSKIKNLNPSAQLFRLQARTTRAISVKYAI